MVLEFLIAQEKGVSKVDGIVLYWWGEFPSSCALRARAHPVTYTEGGCGSRDISHLCPAPYLFQGHRVWSDGAKEGLYRDRTMV